MKHLYVLWATVILLAGACLYSLVEVQTVQHHQNYALNAILCHAERVVERTPASATFTADQKRKAIRFYRDSLRIAHLAPCEQ